jgi:hypothetical protein
MFRSSSVFVDEILEIVSAVQSNFERPFFLIFENCQFFRYRRLTLLKSRLVLEGRGNIFPICNVNPCALELNCQCLVDPQYGCTQRPTCQLCQELHIIASLLAQSTCCFHCKEEDGTPIRLLNIVEPLVIFHFAFSRSISMPSLACSLDILGER